VRLHVHAQRLLRVDPRRPVHLARHRVDLVLVAAGALGQRPQHALRQAALQVQQHRGAGVPAHPHAAAPGLRRRAREALHLLGQQRLGPACGRQEELHRACEHVGRGGAG
jgi:hypothetical protein